MKTIALLFLLAGCSVAAAPAQPDLQCVQQCEDTRTYCLRAYDLACQAQCGGLDTYDVACLAACSKPTESDECGPYFIACTEECK